MTPSERFEQYIRAYANKDMAAVAQMFSDDIHLRDWKISVTGKPAAVAETLKNFEAADTIEIAILNLVADRHSVAGELRIVVDGTEELHVIDVVTFDEDDKISSIRAYLGRPD